MAVRTVQLILHYDGAGFAGWQRQPAVRTVQGELEAALDRLCAAPVAALGSGRTDAGVHARGQAVGVRVTERWTPDGLRRALNAVLPRDIWVAAAHDMTSEFHARYSAVARRYSYHIGLDEAAASPFRRRYEWAVLRPVDVATLHAAARLVVGEHGFRGFAVQGTAPAGDDHRCRLSRAEWSGAEDDRLVFHVEANRFLHHMVRFLVGTMIDAAVGRRSLDSVGALLDAPDNRGVAPPAPAHALFLERVTYPDHLYLHGT